MTPKDPEYPKFKEEFWGGLITYHHLKKKSFGNTKKIWPKQTSFLQFMKRKGWVQQKPNINTNLKGNLT